MFVKGHLQLSFLTWLVIVVSWLGDQRVEAIKKPCKTCKEFVESFEKVCWSSSVEALWYILCWYCKEYANLCS